MNTLPIVRKAPTNKTMGIELECVMSHSAPFMLNGWHGFFYGGRDMSIRTVAWDETGVEFVSQPLTYDWLKKETSKLFKKVGAHYRTNASCGIHVHVSKKWLTDKKAREIYAVLKDLTDDDMRHLFGRPWNRWTEDPIGYRYCCVNITNKATNEFRVFAAGKEKWAQYCIDCAKYMVEHSHHLNVDALMAFRDCYKEL